MAAAGDEINSAKPRRSYLITYSQADFQKFPTRESFAAAVTAVFTSEQSRFKPEHWACCLEQHSDGGGYHYHLALKLTGPKKWLQSKRALQRKYGIVVNFSDHDGYYTAYRYISKFDENVYHSPNHPNLDEIGSPKTKNCQRAYRQRRANNQTATSTTTAQGDRDRLGSPPEKKFKRLCNIDVSEFIQKHNIKNQTTLLALANEQKEEGKKDLAQYVLSRSSKSLDELILQTWRMKDAAADLKRQNTSRIDLIREAAAGNCVESCNGLWLRCAEEVLVNNKVHPILFAAAVRDLLIHGRGKHRNVLIVGPTNCAKTFLFKPLELLFKVFSNPAADKYAWVGADKAEIILLNDFRWSRELIEWKSLLLLLEGDRVNLPAPKNHFVTDVCVDSDIPVFATSKAVIKYRGSYHAEDKLEDDMMASRWRVFQFTHSIPEKEQKQITSCPHCFAKLVLMGEIN
jgi:hypothetical protein